MVTFLTPLSSSQQMHITHEVPAHYNQFKLPSTHCNYMTGPFGDFLDQAIACSGFTIQSHISNIEKGTRFPFVASKSEVILQFMLSGNIPCLLKGFGKVLLSEGLFHLFYIPAHKENNAWFAPGFYHSFHISYTRRFLERPAMKYPELKEVLQRVSRHSPRGLQQHAAFLTGDIRQVIKEMAACPPEEPEKSLYLEARILQLLMHYVQGIPAGAGAGGSLSLRDQKLALAMDTYIHHHMNKPIRMLSLAGHLGISMFTLKKISQAFFRQPPYQHVLQERLKAARQLLLETDKPIKEVALLTGFRSVGTFTTKFKAAFHLTPGAIRDNK